MEKTIDAANFRGLSLPKPHVFVLVLALSLCVTWDARADDAVLVLPTGPARQAQVLGLSEASGALEAVDRGQYLLLDAATGAAPMRDLKILPGERHLLSDVDARGVLITDASGAAEFSLAAPGTRQRISSASVSAYAAPGEVARLLITDSNRSQAFVMDPRNPGGNLNWVKGFALTGSRADFVDAIVLPNQRAAIAINWSTLGVSAVDIYSTQSGSPQTLQRRLAGAPHPNQPQETVLIPELEQLRDIMGLPNQNLLVTTRYTLFEMDLEGDIKWKITMGQAQSDTLMQGEFVGATLLPSGRIALGTAQPGVWTAPDVNHRVYWLSPSALENSEIEVIAQSDALGFAPRRIAALAEHGGSGTFGYRPGLEAQNSGPLSDLEMTRALSINQADFIQGEALSGSADITNIGDDPVMLSRLNILMNAGACASQTDVSISLVEVVALEILAGDTFAVRGYREIDAAFTPGRWCARLFAQNAQGESVELGEAVGFEILEPEEGSGSTTDIEDLEFWPGEDPNEDPDKDPGEVTPPAEFPTPDEDLGCGCASNYHGGPPADLPAGALAFLLVSAAGWMRRSHRG